MKKHEKRENKHPKGESAPTLDFAAESRKFSKLIEVLSEKLKERPELCRGLQLQHRESAGSNSAHGD